MAPCALADDLVIWAPNEQKLQYNLQIRKQALKKKGLRINANKTKVMIIGKQKDKINVKVGEQAVEQVEHFQQLDVTIQGEGSD